MAAGSEDVAPGERLARAVAEVRDRIELACRRRGREPAEVLLVAVTKTVPVDVIRHAVGLGLGDLGENYAVELARKARALPARWHFIGTLQTGTAPLVADHADVIHSAEPGRALDRVAGRAARGSRAIPCLVQVDFTGHRRGLAPDAIETALDRLATLDGVRVAGLMTMPPWTGDPEATRPWFSALRALRDRLRPAHPELAELSMGMSGDYEVAIEEGATMVRVGTALFGARPPGRATTDGSSTRGRR